MKTRTLEKVENEKNFSTKDWKYFEIPDFIQKEVNKKGFFLYEWIDENEIKKSIEIDFLKKLIYFWPIWFVILLLVAFFSGAFWSFIFLLIFTFLLLIYLLFLSISRAFLASKINYIVLTNNHFSVNRKIFKISENKIFLENEILEKSKIFEEDLFDISRLEEKKKEVKNKYTFWLLDKKKKNWNFDLDFLDNSIFRDFAKSKDAQQFLIIIILLLVAFAVTLSIIYFFWIVLVLLMGIFTSYLNKKFLIWKWHKVLIINNHFENIENFSKEIEKEKNSLKNLLTEATKNNWQDWLLLKINSWIENINKNTLNSIKENSKLLKNLKNSEFSEIFDYNLYNSWLKIQLITPIKWIIEMLEENIKIIETEISQNFWNENISDKKLEQHLEIAKNRLLTKKESLQNHIISMKWYLTKLELK